jgi:hypothetical protein
MTEKKTGLDLLREPFPANQIGKLSKETSKQKEEREKDRSLGIKCQECGAWHHRNAVHLDYVGHAALTDRLLDADPNWNWEPHAVRDGLPQFDSTGGMWIRLTVCGVTRLGYGNAAPSAYKDVGAREKEVIGDALRNAAMRFGAALELWHKGLLHVDEETGEIGKPPITARGGARELVKDAQLEQIDKFASGIIDAFTAGTPVLAYRKYTEAKEALKAYGADAHVALWDKFDSAQRSTLKRIGLSEQAGSQA